MLKRLALIVVGMVLPHVALGQGRPEIIVGRILSDSLMPIAGATVSATRAPDRAFLQVTTDTAGRFVIRFDVGTGDYLIHAAALGYRSARRRLTRKAGEDLLAIEITLVHEVSQLAEIRVEAAGRKPARQDEAGRSIGASERLREGVFASVAPTDEGDFAAIAAALPGVTPRPDGVSVLGLSGNQSSTTLNGMAFAGGALPRDADVQVRIATSTYDPARGGFSGGQTAVDLAPGGRFYRRRAHIAAATPLSRSSDGFTRDYTSFTGSIGGSGEAAADVWYYNNALQVSQRTAEATSLLSADSLTLMKAGLAPDSVLRLVTFLNGRGLPLTNGPTVALSRAASFVSRIDHAPYRPGTGDPSLETWNVSTFGSLSDDQALFFSPTSIPTRGGGRRSVFIGGQVDYSRYFGNTLNDARAALNVGNERALPYLRMPTGTVLIASALPDGERALESVTFGGNGALDYSHNNWTWEVLNETQWFASRNPHRLKLTVESRMDGYTTRTAENLLGSFTFASLEALASNQPSGYSRTLISPTRDGREWSGFLALGDYWRVSPSLEMIYGARLEGNRFLMSLKDNPVVASLFGARTVSTPNRTHVSPRFGFTWYFGHTPVSGGYKSSSYASQLLQPTMMLRGGIGEFRGRFPPRLLSEASAANGLPGGTMRLSCLGAATPTPQWPDYLTDGGNGPSTCAIGAASVLADAAPDIELFDHSFDAPRSWRANLAWTRTLGAFAIAIEGIYSLNLNQPGITDLNFDGVRKFTLQEEKDRSVFVPVTSIVSATGLISPTESRRSQAFGRVISNRSDLHSTSRQITFSLSPKEFGRTYYHLSYTLGDMWTDTRGFDGTTFGAPSFIERVPGALDVRHQIQASFGARLPLGMDVALFGRLDSGLPYTPMVSGDINGDGLSNDRAFVFNPATTGDARIAGQMQSLLTSAPVPARDCLERQLDLPAEHNSCRGPWTVRLDARLGLINRSGFTRRGFNATLHVTNPLRGLDQLLHGEGGLRGWGGASSPDPVLLAVRGFDPSKARFIYDVNPRFGSTRPRQGVGGTPFRLTLDLSFDLGVPIVKQQALKLLQPGRRGRSDARMSADSMAKLIRRQVPNIYASIMRESDSLLISREQLDALTAAQIPYLARIDSIWSSTGRELAAMGDDFDSNAAMHLLDDATERAWIVNRDELTVLGSILSPVQMRLAPWVPALQQTVGRKTVGIRMFSF